jgi:hypothetical protein
LTYRRRRLAGSDRPHRLFAAVTEAINQSGVLSARRRRAVDSTILDDAVARQYTVTQLVAQTRRVGRARGVPYRGVAKNNAWWATPAPPGSLKLPPEP